MMSNDLKLQNRLFFIFFYDDIIFRYPTSGNEAFARDLTEWTFQEDGVLKVVSRSHHKEGETEQLEIYRVKDDIVRLMEKKPNNLIFLVLVFISTNLFIY